MWFDRIYIPQPGTDGGKNILLSMMDKIIHRGPNSAGSHVEKNVALGFRRLSIIDLAGGDQPIYNENESFLVAGPRP